jgi:hypothetical protein
VIFGKEGELGGLFWGLVIGSKKRKEGRRREEGGYSTIRIRIFQGNQIGTTL